MRKRKIISGLILAMTVFSGGCIAQTYDKKAESVLKKQVLKEAEWAMKQRPITVTAEHSPRSAGGIHDFYSEGDYWWPDTENPAGPYLQKDGQTNPDNFVAHRHAMIRFSQIIGSLASAYKITGDEKYVKKAITQLKAWFIDSATYMKPNLLYSQAIKGRFIGRGIGVIDAIQLMEVSQGVRVMENSPSMGKQMLLEIKDWFSKYLEWVTTHKYGTDEMNAENNHGTCWVMQVAAFSKLTGNEKLIKFCRDRYRNVLLPKQMAPDGSFPLELKRTKPYGYSLFNLDAMTMICQILSDEHDDLFKFQTPEGLSIKNGIAFLAPYIWDKSKWPYRKDIMYWEEWPVAQPSLIFGASAFQNEEWFQIWKSLDHQPKNAEVIRNLPVRHPLIWFN